MLNNFFSANPNWTTIHYNQQEKPKQQQNHEQCRLFQFDKDRDKEMG